jgi:hypothetical protein
MIDALVKRARLQSITQRAALLEDLHAMLDGTYAPPNGQFTPRFEPDTARHAAFTRATRKVATTVPLILTKTLAGLDFGNITWSDAAQSKESVDAALGAVDLGSIARDAARQYKLAGVAAVMASTPLDENGRAQEPTLEVLTGLNIPYTDPRAPNRVTGWLRAIQYLDENAGGRLRWWVEVYEFVTDQTTIHRVWRSLRDPTALDSPVDDEFVSSARPRFAIYGLQPDGLPTSPILTNLGRILGLYASELTLATSEELAAFPMLLTRGEVEFKSVGPAEVLAADTDGSAEWLDPGDLDQLREQVRLKRDQVREACNLPGGALGGQTPSGEALAEANRGFMQEIRATSDAISGALTEAVTDYLRLLSLPEVDVSVPIDRAYTTSTLLDVVKEGAELQAIPKSVIARMFQQFLGTGAYSDEELAEFLELGRPPDGGVSPTQPPQEGEA